MKRYVDAPLLKRLGAFILDLFTVVLGATIILIGCMEFFSNSQLMKDANNIINTIQVESHLYVYNSEGMTEVVSEDKYSVALENYYLNYKEDDKTYHQMMTESKLFEHEDGNYSKKDNVTDEEVLEFYKEKIGEALVEIKEIEEYKNASNIIINCEFYSIVISILISYIVFIILIPIFRKNKNTLGQRVLNLALVNRETYEPLTKTPVVFRAIIILIVEILIGINSLGLPVIISVGFMLFRTDKASYHDLLSSTRLIDYHYVEIDNERKKGNKEKYLYNK